MQIKLVKIFTLIITLFVFPIPVSAAPRVGIGQPEGTGVIVGRGTADSLLETVLRNGVIFVFTFASIAVVLYFLWGAFDFIISQGDKEKIASARRKMTYALIGLAILALSFALMGLVGSIVGINPLQQTIPFLGQPRR